MSIWLLAFFPSCRMYVMSCDVCRMSIWQLSSPSTCRVYVISFDVYRMWIWLLGFPLPAGRTWSFLMPEKCGFDCCIVPLSCRSYVMSFDISGMWIWLRYCPLCRSYVKSFVVCRMWIWLLCSCRPADRTWPLFRCLQNVGLTAVLAALIESM